MRISKVRGNHAKELAISDLSDQSLHHRFQGPTQLLSNVRLPFSVSMNYRKRESVYEPQDSLVAKVDPDQDISSTKIAKFAVSPSKPVSSVYRRRTPLKLELDKPRTRSTRLRSEPGVFLQSSAPRTVPKPNYNHKNANSDSHHDHRVTLPSTKRYRSNPKRTKLEKASSVPVPSIPSLPSLPSIKPLSPSMSPVPSSTMKSFSLSESVCSLESKSNIDPDPYPLNMNMYHPVLNHHDHDQSTMTIPVQKQNGNDLLRHYVMQQKALTQSVRFDRFAVTQSNGKKIAVSSKALGPGVHEWSIRIMQCDVEIQEIGVCSVCDLEQIQIHDDGVTATPDLGARGIYGSELGSASIWYCSWNRDGARRCTRDLSPWYHIGWTAKDTIKVFVDVDKSKIKYFINGKRVCSRVSS